MATEGKGGVILGKADGYVRIDTKVNTAGAKAGLGSLMGTLSKFAAAAGLAFGVAALVGFGKQCIKIASDLAEVQNVIDVTFGASAGKINDFAKTAAVQFGLSELAAKKYAGTMGAMFKSMGFGEDAAADMSMEMTGLAGDMASFYNLDADEAFAKIRSGISGETEPLKQLGVNLSEANLSAYALTQGITGSYSAMTEQNKALLRYNYLLESTSDAQGDFTRTSSGWANQVRVLGLQFDTLKGTLGGALIAVFAPVLRWLNVLMGALNSTAVVFANFITALTGQQQTATTATAGSTAAMDDLTASTEASGAAATAAGKAAAKGAQGFDELNIQQKDSGGGGGGGGASFAATTTETTASPAAGALASGMADGVKSFFATYEDQFTKIAGKWDEMKLTVSGIFSGLQDQVAGTDIVGAGFTAFLAWVYAAEAEVALLVNIVGQLILALNIPATIESVLSLLADYFTAVGAAVDAVTPGIQAFVRTALVPMAQWIGEKIRDGLDFLGTQLTKIGTWFKKNKDTFTKVFDALSKAIQAVWKVAEPIFNAVWDVLKDIFAKIVDAALELGEYLAPLIEKASAFVEAFLAWAEASGILAFIIATVNQVGDAFGYVIDYISGRVKAVIKILSGLIDFLTGVFTGDWKLMWAGIKQIFGGIWDAIGTTIEAVINVFKLAWQSISNQATLAWTLISNFFSGLWEAITTGVKSAWEAIGSWLKTFWSGVSTVASGIWNGIAKFFKGIWDGISTAARTAWDGIKAVWIAVSGWFNNTVVKPISDIFEDLAVVLEDVWEGIWTMIKKFINYIIGGVESMVNGVVKGINAIISGINKVISKVGDLLGLDVAIPKLSTVSLPRLAQGAVIPPNREFAAILGDQKRGINIETPLDTMLQAFRAALSEGGNTGPVQVNVTFKGELGALAAILAPEVTIAQNRNNQLAGNTLQVI